MKLVLFDCDGTLVDSAPVIHECMRRTFVDYGYAEPRFEATKSIIGLTLDIAIGQILGIELGQRTAEMTARYKEHFILYRSDPDFAEPAFAGIHNLVGALGQIDDVILGVVTGKSRNGLDRVLEHQGFENHFVTRRTADDCPSKPHPAMVLECCDEVGIAPENTVVIGDAIYDMQMARSAGAKAFGVAWGYAEHEALNAAGAHAVLTAPHEFNHHFSRHMKDDL